MLKEVISQSRIDITETLAPFLRGNMFKNLDRSQQSLKSCCSDDVNFELWIGSPLLADLDTVCEDDKKKDDLIELRKMQMVKSNFNSRNVAEFWCSLTQAYPRYLELRELVILVLRELTNNILERTKS